MRDCLAVDMFVMARYKLSERAREGVGAETRVRALTFAATLRKEGRVIDSRASACDRSPINILDSGAARRDGVSRSSRNPIRPLHFRHVCAQGKI